MQDYLLLMHDDVPADAHPTSGDAWNRYMQTLREAGAFEGGSAIGSGICLRKSGSPPSITTHLTGYLRVQAPSFDAACALVAGNPDYEAGGTVEVRELPRD
jgi:hypothetical protein